MVRLQDLVLALYIFLIRSAFCRQNLYLLLQEKAGIMPQLIAAWLKAVINVACVLYRP